MAELPEDDSVEYEAAQWVARRIGDEPFDKEGFEAWLAGDPRRQALFDTMWRRFMGPNTDAALGALVQQRRSRRAWRAGAGSAAAVALALLAVSRAWPTLELFMSQPRDYAAAQGTLREVRLEDGTRLTLAGGAEVRVRYTRRSREVELARGTIFADVRHDEARTFQVDAGRARVTDLGTRFEVSRKPSDVRVTVEAGAVRLGASGWFGKRIDLAAGQAAVLSEAGLSRTDDVGQGRVARWRAEWVEYHHAPMKQVVADLESMAPLPIRIADGDLADLKVSGRIRLTDPMTQINNLSVIHRFAVAQSGGAIVLSDRRTGP